MRKTASKTETLAALSRALDLVEGQPPGHAVRTAFVAARIGSEIGLDAPTRRDLLRAALLKDSGCSTNAARIQKVFGGDEFEAKRAVKFVAWTSPLANAVYGLRHIGNGERLPARLARLARAVPQTSGKANFMAEVTAARCTRGAEIARRLGFSPAVAEAIRDLDEHWDGDGAPQGRSGRHIPLLARILGLSQTLEVFAYDRSPEEAFRILRRRRGRWFDPELCDAALVLRRDEAFWAENRDRDATDVGALPDLEDEREADGSDLDAIGEAFALIVDAKSSFTAEHSTRVTHYAGEIALDLGLPPAKRSELRRAALLHDVGKLGVSSAILEKDGRLTDEEFARVKLHPRRTWEILHPIRGLADLADLAGAHHERLDGRGYWRGWGEAELTLSMRILAAADVFDALSADRPYREAMPLDRVFGIMEGEAGSHLDARCAGALRDRYGAAPLPIAA